jgi:hypothetical protein
MTESFLISVVYRCSKFELIKTWGYYHPAQHKRGKIIKRSFRTNILVLVLSIFSLTSFAEYKYDECLEIKGFLKDSLGKIECTKQFHHFNALAVGKYYNYKEVLAKKNVRVGTFNVYQAGSTRTEYKDYELVARIINNWDVVAAVELLSSIGIDLKHNTSIVDLLNKVEEDGGQSLQDQINFKNNKDLSKDEIIKLLKAQYVFPGYIKILRELQKLDPSWALVLSGREEGADGATIRELSGFYYRATVVKPVVNEYCEEFHEQDESIGCFPLFRKKSYGADVSHLMARRPFMGSFRSGNFDFTLLATHTVFNAPSNEDLRREILQAAFGVDDYVQIGQGVTSATFARFAEIYHILNFTKKYRERYKEDDVIIMGDLNLEGKNDYWSTLLAKFPHMKLKIEGPTSLAQARTLSDGTSTNGTANNYDHFIFDPNITGQCAGKSNARIFNFIENSFKYYVDNKYIVRGDEEYIDAQTGLVKYSLKEGGQEKMNSYIYDYLSRIDNKFTVKNGKIVPRFKIEDKRDDILRKIFVPQLFERSYYRIYQEVISDHLPIFMNCTNTFDRDNN